MVPHEDTTQVRSRAGSGRHRGGRPGPEHTGGSRPGTTGTRGRHGLRRRQGAALRMPAFRVSGAAMAMSTVVGISVATTWIVSVQGGLQPSVRISDVNGAPSTPDGDAPDGSDPSADTRTPPALAGRGSPEQSAASRDGGSARPAPTVSARALSSSSPGLSFDASRPTPRASGPASPQTSPGGTAGGGTDSGGSGAPSAPATGSAAPATGTAVAPASSAPSEEAPAAIELTPGILASSAPEEGLHGTASADTADPYASRDSLELTVDEAVTALEVEVRVERSGGAADGGAWTSMPGVGVTVECDAGTLVYRFTLRPGETALPGRYAFTVQYTHQGGRHDAAADTWLASAFGVEHPRAVAVRGHFA